MKTQLAALPNIGCSAPWYLWSGWEGDRKLEIEASECAVPTDTNREMADYSFLIPLVSDINREFACIWFYFTHSNLTIFLVMFFLLLEDKKKKINIYFHVEMCDHCAWRNYFKPLSSLTVSRHLFHPSFPPCPCLLPSLPSLFLR